MPKKLIADGKEVLFNRAMAGAHRDYVLYTKYVAEALSPTIVRWNGNGIHEETSIILALRRAIRKRDYDCATT